MPCFLHAPRAVSRHFNGFALTTAADISHSFFDPTVQSCLIGSIGEIDVVDCNFLGFGLGTSLVGRIAEHAAIAGENSERFFHRSHPCKWLRQ